MCYEGFHFFPSFLACTQACSLCIHFHQTISPLISFFFFYLNSILNAWNFMRQFQNMEHYFVPGERIHFCFQLHGLIKLNKPQQFITAAPKFLEGQHQKQNPFKKGLIFQNFEFLLMRQKISWTTDCSFLGWLQKNILQSLEVEALSIIKQNWPDKFNNMNGEYGSNQDLDKLNRRRVYTRTQSSAFRHPNRQYHLANNLYSKQNTYMTAGSNGSEPEIKSRSRVRSTSSKSLFSGAKLKNYSQARLKLKKKDNFIIPTNTRSNKTIEDYEVNPALQQVLHQKMNRQDKLKIKQQVEYSMLRKIVDQASKTVKNKIQEAFSLKLQQRKENLSKVSDVQKFNSLVSDYVQTEEDSQIKKKQRKVRRMLKTQVYNMEVSQPRKELKLQKNKVEEPKVAKKAYDETQKYHSVKEYEKEVRKQEKKVELMTTIETLEKKQEKLISKKQLEKIPKQQNQPPKKRKTSYNNYDELDEIEDIVLSPQSKYIKKGPDVHKGKEKNLQEMSLAKAQEQAEKEQREQKQRQKIKITEQLTESNRVIDIITPIGEVAGYCAQLLKKSKLNWHTPAILLYRDCYQKFKKYQEVYIKAAQLGVIEEEEKNKFIQDNKLIQKNLQKIISMGKKKSKLSEEYEKIVNQTEPINLDRTIQKEVLNFAKTVIESDQKNNFDVMVCLLRMINGVIILGKLKGLNIVFDYNIDQIDQDSVDKAVFKGLKLIELKQLKL